MIFSILTLTTALGLASVAGWFSIVGMMAIFAGSPIHALILGVVLESGKLVTTSWIYRNWLFVDWKLKTPLIIFTFILMLTTSIGVFGFLSKAHLDQGANTIDNSAKAERIDQQINKEKSSIADNEKVISQLDSTINSYLGKDRADRSVVIRKSQAPQRKELRDEIEVSHKKLDTLGQEKFDLESEVRKIQLEVGPIRYIAELIYGTDDTQKNIESAVRIFTLLIVSTLDPLAIILLIAANHSLLRRQNEEKEKNQPHRSGQHRDPVADNKDPVTPNSYSIEESVSISSDNLQNFISEESHPSPVQVDEETKIYVEVPEDLVGLLDEDEKTNNQTIKECNPARPELRSVHADIIPIADTKNNNDTTLPEPVAETIEEIQKVINQQYEEEKAMETFKYRSETEASIYASIRVPAPSTVSNPAVALYNTKGNAGITPITQTPWAHQETVLRELIGAVPHFIPQKINEEKVTTHTESSHSGEVHETIQDHSAEVHQISEESYRSSENSNKKNLSYIQSDGESNEATIPARPLSWITEYKR